MPMLMGELLATWRELERAVDSLTDPDPRAAQGRALLGDIRDTYQRLHDVFPRPQEDTDHVLLLISRARGFLHVPERETEPA
jgi:predicted metal-dependent enzyme (double-stranded beta helix superfamily)